MIGGMYRGTNYYTEPENKKRPVMGGVKIEIVWGYFVVSTCNGQFSNSIEIQNLKNVLIYVIVIKYAILRFFKYIK